MTTISIKGLDRATVLYALFTGALGRQGLVAEGLSPDEIQAIYEASPHKRFDYIKGRPLKVILDSDDLDVRRYNRDNGEGQAERIIEQLHSSQVAT